MVLTTVLELEPAGVVENVMPDPGEDQKNELLLSESFLFNERSSAGV